jgi:pimeloyl-ACP methyl ester carboxylesterase
MNFVGILSVWNASLVYFPFRVSLVLIVATVFGFSGCSSAQFVVLREKPRNPLAEHLRLWSPAGPEPSPRTEEFLVASGATPSRDVRTLLQHTRRAVKQVATEESLHAAAELSYLTARQTESDDAQLAAELYLDAAQYSWQYLTGNNNQRVRNPNAVEHRVTTDVYNSSVEGFMRLVNAERSSEHREGFSLPLTGRSIRFEVPQPSAWIHPDQVGEIEFVSDYEVKNLRHRHVTSGVGVPIMIHRQRPEPPSQLEEYYADGLRFPATALLRFPTPQEQYSGTPIRLQIYDPRDSEGVVIRNTLVPIETDLSTPLARFLTNPDLELLDTFAFLRPDKAKSLQGLYMVQPWDPDRIPVLMVHGLWSSPMTWMEMFNELQSHPVLRDHYQFWFYMYPTGEPLAFSLADLRDDLEELQERCDPLHRNEKLDQMVLVGHSMGGLLSYLLTVDSDDKLWNSVSETPVAELRADDETTSEIERVFFFESDPSVDRIVTIASPFQGSRYANRFTRWLSQAIVSLPTKTLEVTQLMSGLNSQQGWKNVFTPRTSLDSLAKESAVVNLIGQTTTQDSVIHNNIVGVSRGLTPKWWTDGVVTYRSAHRDDADTEITVTAGHSQVHRHENSIKEVTRALKDHLKQVKGQHKVIAVGQSAD